MLNLENKTFVIMGIANKRSIGFGVAKVLDKLGAKLEKQLNQNDPKLYQIDVQKTKMLLMVLLKLKK